MKTRKALSIFAATLLVFSALACASASAAPAKSGPGPVVITFMERAEAHNGVPMVDPANPAATQKEGELYLYSLLSAFRKLDKGVTGNLYYMNKYSVDNSNIKSHIYGLDITDALTGKWVADLGYSYSSNPVDPETNPLGSSSHRVSFGLNYKWNPGEKAKKRISFKTSLSTNTDFSSGQTLSEKLTIADNISKKMDYALAYQFVWGLSQTENPVTGRCAMCREQFANQYYADLNYKITKKDKLQLGFLFLKNLYNGARGDDGIAKLSYFRTIR